MLTEIVSFPSHKGLIADYRFILILRQLKIPQKLKIVKSRESLILIDSFQGFGEYYYV